MPCPKIVISIFLLRLPLNHHHRHCTDDEGDHDDGDHDDACHEAGHNDEGDHD